MSRYTKLDILDKLIDANTDFINFIREDTPSRIVLILLCVFLSLAATAIYIEQDELAKSKEFIEQNCINTDTYVSISGGSLGVIYQCKTGLEVVTQ